MTSKFVVIDNTGNVSFDDDSDGPESFGTLEAAVARAEALATTVPGEEIGIFRLVSMSIVPIGEVATLPVEDGA